MNASAMGGPRTHLFAALTVTVLLAGTAFRWMALDQVPPGLHYDEAAYGLQAIELAQHPRLEVFFPAFTGREPMFIYIEALALTLAGHSVFVLRSVSAAVGILGIASTIAVGRRFFGEWVGLVAGALLAVSFWHITIVRMAYRAGLLAALGPIAILCIWRAWQKPTVFRGLLAGGLVGTLAYTYVSVRLLPIGLLLFVFLMVVGGPLRQRNRIVCAVIIALVALAIASPLLLYFRDHPSDFAIRFEQTSAITGEGLRPATIVGGIRDTIRMYGWTGDALQKYNLPLRPALDPILSALFFIGVAKVCVQWRDPKSALILGWLVGTLMPGFITNDSPNFLRLIGSAPPSYLLAALGAATFARLTMIAARFTTKNRKGPTKSSTAKSADNPHAAWSTAITLGCICLISVEAVVTYRDYFRRWALSSDTFVALDGDLAAVGVLARGMQPGPPILVSSEHFRHPTVAFLAESNFWSLRWFDGRHALVLPPDSKPFRYLIPASANPPFHEMLGDPIEPILNRFGQTAASTFLIHGPGMRGIPINQLKEPIGFGREREPDVAELLVIAAPPRATAGDDIEVTSVWRLLTDQPPMSLDVFAHALDSGGRRWGQRDISPYLTSEWRAGEMLIVRSVIRLDPTSPPGSFIARVGLNETSAQRSLSPRTTSGVSALKSTHQVVFQVSHGSSSADVQMEKQFLATAAIDAHRWTGPKATFESVRLIAATIPKQIVAGQTGWIDLLWEARSTNPGGSALIRLRSATSEAPERTISARELSTIDPERQWKSSEQIRDSRRFSPRRGDAGAWDVVVYVGNQDVTIGRVMVTAPATQSGTVPAPQQVVDARFGDVARLIGIERTTAGVRLIWQARGPSDENLSVFVHALGPGDSILAQHDGQPDGGRQPTREWIDGDVIIDEHQMTLPADVNRLAIGLYNPSDGKRILMTDLNDRVVVKLPPVIP